MGRREVPTRLPAAPATLRAALCVVVVVLCWASSITYGFSFSFMHDLGLAYSQGETVHVLAKSVTSRSKIVPLRWSSVFPCAASLSQSTLPPSRRSIGQVLMGETLEDSGIRLKVLTDMKCVLICSARFNTAEREQYEKRILGRYRAHLVLDGLPALEAPSVDGEHRRIRTGFPLGNFSRAVATGIIEAYNHLHLIVSYYPITSADSLTVRIVQFEVQPRSVYHTSELGGDGTCTFPAVLKPQITPMESIRFSYSVEWVVSTTPWKTRWDNYVDDNSRESKARWHSIVNVLSLVLLQSVLLWYILVRSVRRDILSYNEEDLLGDREDSGWKLVHGDVFRPPRGAVFLSVLVGNGMQIMCMVIASLLFAVAGMLSHDSRGTLASLLVMLFVLFSSVNGLVTASLIKLLRRRSWQAIFLTSIALPGFLFVVYLTLNFIHLGSHAASTLPFTSLLYLLALWLCVSVPLCFGGAVAGFSSNISIPAKINAIPRTIPPQPWYVKGVFSYVALGIVPLAASYVELQSIFSSVWLGVAYRMFSFLLAAFVLVLVIVAQVSIFSTYNQLSLLNYHWWWRSFFVSASYGAWLMLYCVLYYWFISVVKGFLGMILFFGYMGLACVTVALMFGAVGFLASLVFVRILFASVKAD
ncbi:putative endosomal integral membrane protein [Leishmania infantum JPCM5]|uniref:Transmembrane 9 superfamily member n=2 Tax=Leishmania infantum TaxID=5671 RepID=A0A6L0XV64_LEIIN|nr:putative endosomal integral membrane protein [Leishmania infantum JPCM5]CAC9511830.1 endosomal_integral_membrane_protein_-_putative [Leishmania infantum]CAM69931.1 putative endosomal integral membrane protein [Leishmania infantum JPCM5]SUZ43849.1 endosomal_integral_membrane_protein_-_putative [Leishmania infantum]|eukprot:XP_001466882.1 putative endosomal integral membrane protein [Leishmania infantum JPCM5]